MRNIRISGKGRCYVLGLVQENSLNILGNTTQEEIQNETK